MSESPRHPERESGGACEVSSDSDGASVTVEGRIAAVRAMIRAIPDFPRPGILFRDLTPLMGDGPTMRACCELLGARVARHQPDVIVAIESRGFIFGAPVAVSLGIAFAPVRKPGKLPGKVDRRTYALEYGTDSLEMHADAVTPGKRVVIVDDLLATGGTAEATAALVRQQGGQVVAFSFVVELAALAGRVRLDDALVESLIVY